MAKDIGTNGRVPLSGANTVETNGIPVLQNQARFDCRARHNGAG